MAAEFFPPSGTASGRMIFDSSVPTRHCIFRLRSSHGSCSRPLRVPPLAIAIRVGDTQSPSRFCSVEVVTRVVVEQFRVERMSLFPSGITITSLHLNHGRSAESPRQLAVSALAALRCF